MVTDNFKPPDEGVKKRQAKSIFSAESAYADAVPLESKEEAMKKSQMMYFTPQREVPSKINEYLEKRTKMQSEQKKRKTVELV